MAGFIWLSLCAANLCLGNLLLAGMCGFAVSLSLFGSDDDE